jgi:hypothetical protein
MTTSSRPRHLNLRPTRGDYHDATQYAFAHRPDWAKLPWHRPKPICLVVSLTLWNFQSGSKEWMLSYCHATAASATSALIQDEMVWLEEGEQAHTSPISCRLTAQSWRDGKNGSDVCF